MEPSMKCQQHAALLPHPGNQIPILHHQMVRSQPVYQQGLFKARFSESKSLIAEGGFSKVYRVKDNTRGEQFAVKQMIYPVKQLQSNEFGQRLAQILREAELLEISQHPNVLKLTNYWLELKGRKSESSNSVTPAAKQLLLVSNTNALQRQHATLSHHKVKPRQELTEEKSFIDNSFNDCAFGRGDSGHKSPLPNSPVRNENTLASTASTCCSISSDNLIQQGQQTLQQPQLDADLKSLLQSYKYLTVNIQTKLYKQNLLQLIQNRNSEKARIEKAQKSQQVQQGDSTDLQNNKNKTTCMQNFDKKVVEEQESDFFLSEFMAHEKRQAARIARQVVTGLRHLHALGIVHRDIKPLNIFLDFNNEKEIEAVIGDFGLAAFQADLLKKKQGLQGAGTPQYMSPEQHKGLPINHKSDIYSLGIVMLELFFTMKTQMELIQTVKQLKAGIVPQGLPEPFAKLLHRCLAENLDSRPQLEEIEQILAQMENEDQQTNQHQQQVQLLPSHTTTTLPSPCKYEAADKTDVQSFQQLQVLQVKC